MYKIMLAVRDYECDMQGIVNNACYSNYFEHARHVFLKERGLNFAELSLKGMCLVMSRAEIDYIRPLQSGDKFYVTVSCERVSKIKFIITQTVTIGDIKYTDAKFNIVGINQEKKLINLDGFEIKKLL